MPASVVERLTRRKEKLEARANPLARRAKEGEGWGIIDADGAHLGGHDKVWSIPDAFVWLGERYQKDSREANPAQREAILDRHQAQLFCGGVGSGKTTALVVDHIKSALLCPNAKSFIVAARWTTLELNTIPALEELLPEWAVDPTNRPSKDWRYGHSKRNYVYIRLLNGHETFILTVNNQTKSDEAIQGASIVRGSLEEGSMNPRETWEFLVERLRGPIPKWFYRQLFVSAVLGNPGWLEDLFWDAEKTDIYHRVEFSTQDAVDAGVQEQAYVDLQKATLSKIKQQRKLEGRRVIYQGLVYGPRRYESGEEYQGEFGQDRHHPCWLRWEYKKDLPVIGSWDFGFLHASFHAWQLLPKGLGIVAFKELLWEGVSTLQQAMEIKALGFEFLRIHTDPSAKAEHDRKTARQILGHSTVRCCSQDDKMWNRTNREDLVRQKCCDQNNERHIWIAESLHGVYNTPTMASLWQAMGAFRLTDAQRGKAQTGASFKDNIHDHVFDDLAFAAVGEMAPRAWSGVM